MIRNPQYPLLDQRRSDMIVALEKGHYMGLVDHLYKTAVTDSKEICSNNQSSHTRNVKSSMLKLIEDRDGERRALGLLMRIPEEVLRALIMNDVAYKAEMSQSFRALCQPRPGVFAGIYGNTLSIRGRNGKFLSSNEMQAYVEMVDRYMEGKKNDREAIQIDSAVRNSRWNVQDTKDGDRLWADKQVTKWRPKGWTPIFAEMLEARIWQGTSVERQAYSNQSPLEIGCSKDINRRLLDHSPSGNLANSTKAWGLALSCLKTLGYDLQHFPFKVMLVVDFDELQLAEILVTMVSGSLIEDGGYNSYQAGVAVSAKDLSRSFFPESNEVFTQSTGLHCNIQKSGSVIDRRLEALEGVEDLATGNTMFELDESMRKLDIEMDTSEDEYIQTAIRDTRVEIEELEEKREQINKVLKQLDLEIELETELLDWIGGSSDSPINLD